MKKHKIKTFQFIKRKKAFNSLFRDKFYVNLDFHTHFLFFQIFASPLLITQNTKYYKDINIKILFCVNNTK